MNKSYHKIETLYTFNQETKTFDNSQFRSDNVKILENNNWFFTEKVDGTNVNVYWDGYKVTISGRNEKSVFSKPQQEFLDNIFSTYEFEHLMEQLFSEKKVNIYGELFGNNIQKVGKLYSNIYMFQVFDIKVEEKWLEFDNVKDVCDNLGLEPVIEIGYMTIGEAINYVKEDNKSFISNEAPLEGIVGVPVGNFLDSNGNRIIIKIKKRDI